MPKTCKSTAKTKKMSSDLRKGKTEGGKAMQKHKQDKHKK